MAATDPLYLRSTPPFKRGADHTWSTFAPPFPGDASFDAGIHGAPGDDGANRAR